MAAPASLTGAGANGDNGGSTGGGGGGAGLTGGTGGTSTNGGDGGDGGAHAYVGDGAALTSGTLALTGGAGGDGVTPAFYGGGGGGGGGFGAVVTGASNLSVSDGAISGGDGGDGGGSPTHYGGRGGSGGSGLVLNNVSGTTSVQADVTGGDGGNGGDAANGSQNPGADGGTAIRVVGNGGPVALTVSGVVTGGDGGNAGTSSQYRTDGGDGGAGISGSKINVVLTGAASVSGGIGGTAENSGTAGANGSAINFTGGSNSLELQANSGGSVATISGGISHVGSGDKLVLGGANDASLAVSGLNSGGLYAGFGSYEKSGSSTWSLTGTTTSTRNWSIADGTLRLLDAAIGSGAVSIASGAALEINRTTAGTIANSISGAGSLTKSGSGTLTLTGTNSYSGGTAVSAGRIVGAASAIKGDVAVSSGATVEFDQAADATFGSVISGAGSLAKSGAGALTLTGTNTYAGDTAVTGGRLVGSTTAIRGDVAVSSGATVEYSQSSDATLSNVISGAGALAKSGAGALTVTGANTYTGGTAITAGRLVGSTSAIRGDVAVSSGATVEYSQSSDATLSNVVSGAGALEKSGVGTLTLTGANTYTGGTAITAGRLVGAASAIRGDVAVSSGATVEYSQSSDATVNDVVSGGGALTKSGAGTLTLTGANTYTGGTAITAGRLAGSTGAIRGDVAVSSGATVEYNQSSDATLSDVVSGGGSLAKSGAGTLTLTGANTYTGGTAVTAGRLAGSTSAIRGDVAVSSGATVEYNQSSDATLSDVISGAGSLAKSGAGTLTLTGANTYAGGTAVTAGRLAGSTGAIRGDVAVSSGATVEYSQSSDATLSDVISGGGSLAKSGAGTLTLTGANTYTGGTAIIAGRLVGSASAILGDVSVSSGAEVEFDQATDATVNGQITGAGSLAKSGAGTLTLTGANSYSGGTTIAAGRLVGSASAIRGDVSVSSGAALEYNQASNGTVANAISGAGSLTKSGSGTLTLTGANTYAGGTTVSVGRLVGSSSAIRGDVSVSSGATVEFDQAADATLNNIVSGAGALEKSGNGTLTLTGANTYSGGTVITAGRLVGSASAIRGDVAVSSGSTVEFDQAADATFNNVVSGSGTLTKSGTGTLTLTGANTYTGGTDITAGRLVGSAGAIRGDVSVSAGATVEFSQTSDATTSGGINGAGSLTKSGAGTLTLGNAATHTGGTTVKGGRLVANTSTISGDIQVDTGAVMHFDQAVNADYSGAISGSGALEKNGAGILTLTGSFSLTGKTSVFNGELIVAASNLGPSSSFDLSGGELTVSGGSNATISSLQMGTSDGTLKLTGGSLTVANAVTSTQALALTGAGTLNLDAAGSSIGGGVMLSNGSLIVGSSSSNSSAGLAGDVAVATGATLGGHGTITGTVTNAGRLAPGNSIGTLTIAGNYAGTGTLEIEVDGDTSGTPSADQLIVNGTVDVSGTDLDLVLTPATASSWAYAPTGPFTIIDNDGTDAITGTFASVTDNLLFLDPLLDYAAGTGNDIALTLLRNDIDFVSAASNSNQFSTAAAIEGLGYSNPIYLSVVSTVSSNALAQAAFDSLSGEINATLRSVLLADSRLSRGAVLSHLASAEAGAPLWAQAIGNWNSFGHDGNGAAADSATGGFVAGVDQAYSDAITFGVMGGYTRTGMSVGALASNATMESLQAGVYLGGAQGAWTYRAGLLGAYNMVETDRVAAVPGGFSQSLTSNQDVMSVQAFVETGYAFNLDGATLEPFAGLAQVHLRSGSFSETGGSAALTAQAQSNDVTFSWIGLRAETAVSLFGVDATAKASAAWQHASAENASFSHGFAGGAPFTVKGTSFARDMALIETGIAMEFGGGAALDLSYQGQFGKDVESHGFNARLSAKF